MSNAQGIAFLSFGLIVGSGSFPDPYDVRSGVDNGTGSLGTLVIPAVADVRAGVAYGGDGDEYLGLLVTGAASGDNEMAMAYAELQTVFNQVLNESQTVDIDGDLFAAIIEEVTFDEIQQVGGEGESGGFRVMIAISDFPTKPEKLLPITARGQELQILEVINTNDVTWTITAGDPGIE